MRLKGKSALITGGASGIGRATAVLYAEEGANVAVMDLDREGGAGIVKEINENGGNAHFIYGDVSQDQDCKCAVEETVKLHGELNILFNNAGIISRTTVLEITEQLWDKVMAVNVKSIYLLSKHAIPEMKKAGGGVILNTGSGWGLTGGQRAVSYCASKGAVVLMTRAMARDHGPDNIRVNCICPGDTDTDMLRNEMIQLGQDEKSYYEEAADRPLKRYGIPKDIANAALYLVCDESSYITGTTLVVDGGGLA